MYSYVILFTQIMNCVWHVDRQLTDVTVKLHQSHPWLQISPAFSKRTDHFCGIEVNYFDNLAKSEQDCLKYQNRFQKKSKE